MTNRTSIAIFGSGDVERYTARTLFEWHLSPFVDQGRTWLLGGTRGIDEWAIEWLLERNELCWAVVPHTRFDQPKSIQPWLEQLERVVELQLPGRKSARAFRNRYMVDLCGIVIGFRSGKGSGTLTILKYALRKQREVHAIPLLTADDEDHPEDEELSRGWPR
ncbi:MAG TPA: DNA-processing protein DprA [Pyrinomonadaceae bacterium]|nr:DNA-processing protein DprA [Pyrinomonadaceae bacterium]